MTNDPVYAEAIERFGELFRQGEQTELRQTAAVTLATVDGLGHPTARIVLLRGFDQRGFVFYSNSQSDKGKHLADNPYAALCFYWDPLSEQVRVEGRSEQVSIEESDAYWATRPHESQIGAWASLQSQPLANREFLQQRFDEYQQQFDGQDVPRPDYWLGYRIVPNRIEFWTSRPARLHDRVSYERQPHGWSAQLLYP